MYLGGGDGDAQHSHLSHAEGIKRRIKSHMKIAGK
jgi:hypothetical protein